MIRNVRDGVIALAELKKEMEYHKKSIEEIPRQIEIIEKKISELEKDKPVLRMVKTKANEIIGYDYNFLPRKPIEAEVITYEAASMTEPVLLAIRVIKGVTNVIMFEKQGTQITESFGNIKDAKGYIIKQFGLSSIIIEERRDIGYIRRVEE